MRDPLRIVRVLASLMLLWREMPDMRLGQLVMVLAKNDDLFNLEDDVLLDRINAALNTGQL